MRVVEGTDFSTLLAALSIAKRTARVVAYQTAVEAMAEALLALATATMAVVARFASAAGHCSAADCFGTKRMAGAPLLLRAGACSARVAMDRPARRLPLYSSSPSSVNMSVDMALHFRQ